MIRYVTGDATKPDEQRPKGEGLIVAHVCNDAGGWGAGFSGAVSQRWKFPEQDYLASDAEGQLALGSVQCVAVSPAKLIYVVNMIAQHGYSRPGAPAIRYGALFLCLRHLDAIVTSCRLSWNAEVSVHMPRIGSGLAGGQWTVVESLINEALPEANIYVYDLPKKG